MLFKQVVDWDQDLEILITLEPSDEPAEEGDFRFITENGRFYWKKSLALVGFVTTPYAALGSMIVAMEPTPPHPLLLAFLQKVAIAYKVSVREAKRSGEENSPGDIRIKMGFIN